MDARYAPWHELRHPNHPFSFSVPEGTIMFPVPYPFVPGSGTLRRRDGSVAEEYEFQYRQVNRAHSFFALHLRFAWITPQDYEVDSAEIGRLAEATTPLSYDGAIQLVSGLIPNSRSSAWRDGGFALVGGRRGHVLLSGDMVEGCLEKRLYVVPVNARALLLAVADVDCLATLQERDLVLPRLLDSIEFEDG
jgi:hypothetical protein